MGLLINGQVGWRSAAVIGAPAAASSLWTSVYGVWNADALGTSLDTSIYGVYNGDNVNDTSGNARNGTNVNNVTFTTGKVGNAFTFNGSNYVALPNNIMKFSNTDNFSVSFWIYANVTGYSSVIGNNAYIGGQGTGWGINTGGTAGGNPSNFSIQFFTNWVNGSGTLLNPLQTDGTTSINTWNHFVITRNSSAQEKIYQNGTLVASQTNSSTKLTYPATSYVNIGVNRYDSTGLAGYAKAGSKIDAMSVWTKELTASEITSLYNTGTGAEYPFSSQTLPSPNDAVGTNHGTLMNGCTFATGKIGQAFTFDGINDLVALPNSSFDFTGDFSISAWVKIPSAPSTSAYIFSNYNFDTVTSYGYVLYLNTNRTMSFFVAGLAGSSTVTSTTTLALDTWYHVTIKRDSVAKRSDLYINGVLEAQVTNTGLTIGYGTRAIQPTIGATRNNNQGVLTTSNFLNGQVDALTIWNKKVSDSEVTELYNAGTGKQYPTT